MDFYEKWLEFDFNPWILFDSNGKVLSLNQEAQFLLGDVSSREIFDLALTYANRSYGFKTTMVDLELGRYDFFGLMVGYEDNDAIAIRLYRKPTPRISDTSLENLTLHNIYTLIDLAISTSSINRKSGFTTSFDPAFPEIRIHPDAFVTLLTGMFQCYSDEEPVRVELSLKTGETLKFRERRYPIYKITVSGKCLGNCPVKRLGEIAKELNGYVIEKNDRLILEAPMITG